MYDFTEDSIGDDTKSGEHDSAWEDPVHQLKADSEREWTRMSNEFVNAGYREGITAGKESAVQAGFDEGFANVGVPMGREIGNLRGLAAGVLALLESSRPSTPELEDKSALLAETRKIVDGLSQLQLADLAPPDEEALAHAREHVESNEGDAQLSTAAFATREKAMSDLSDLRRRLEGVLQALSLGNLLPQPANLS